ncbi:D-alanyl-D-alanine carboxypeptidase family protein [Symbioplanes lichenis]|uniref:D-alanyl-D-alanine carboxypeptidase family protein n=1 Tax=Symbioplanes lichenis TaxID=1629072 RepID=UPI0027389DC3|nr:serine hydrolase [Actinoplanes lichenis]
MTFGRTLPTTRRRVVAALAALALGASTAFSPLSSPPAQAATLSGPTGALPGRPAAYAAKADVPCPKPDVKPPAGRPPRPKPPADDPVLRAVGGDALATDGLVVPDGVKKPPALTATTWLVADLDTGEVLGGCGPHVYQTPASVQKLLLAATVMPKLDPKRTITVTEGDLAIEPGSSAVGLLKGGRYTIATLWLGLILQSGNEAANALARLGGGTGGVEATVAAMNAEAKRLGAYQTHAVTPSGLDGPGQFTSAYDLALIARQVFSYPDFGKYALTKATQIPAQKQLKQGGFQIQNENRLIFDYPGALGGKTGFTQLARHSYVGAAQRNGRRLVATLLGAESNPLRGPEQGAALLDWGFSLPKDASVGKLVAPDGQDAEGTAADASAAPVPAAKDKPAPAAARPAASDTKATLALAATIAVVLAATPLLLLLTQRRRRVRRRVRRRPQAFY